MNPEISRSQNNDEFVLRDVTFAVIAFAWPGEDIDITYWPALVEALASQLRALQSVVQNHGGKVHGHVGGYCAFVFGDGKTAGDTASMAWSALQAARRIRCEDAGGSVLPNWGDIRPKVALSTGRALTAIRENSLYLARTAIGDNADRAFRMISMAEPGRIICDAATWRAIGERLDGTFDTGASLTLVDDQLEIYDLTELSLTLPNIAAKPSLVATGAGTTAPNVIRKQGEIWTFSGAGLVLHLNDSKGLNYLAHLLAHPNREFFALDLAYAWQPDPSGISAHPHHRGDTEANDLELFEHRDADAVLDARAKAEYRKRLDALEQEIAEATEFHDMTRASRATEEKLALAHALAAAVGLGGRNRTRSSLSERARRGCACESAVGVYAQAFQLAT